MKKYITPKQDHYHTAGWYCRRVYIDDLTGVDEPVG
jgi:hypothetical protein